MLKEFEGAFVLLSSGVTAGASGIGFTADGRVIHIPSNNPEGYRMVQWGFEMAHVSQSITDAAIKADTQRSVAKLVQAGRTLIENPLKLLPMEAKGHSA
jgi:hypothetical protein